MRKSANNSSCSSSSSSGDGQHGIGVAESWNYGRIAPEVFHDDNRLKPTKMPRLLPATAAAATASSRLPETAAGTSRTLRKSCDSCVRLKRACNGESPCRLCARMGKCCSRSAKKRSGPPKGTKYQPRRQQQQQQQGGLLATHPHHQHNITTTTTTTTTTTSGPGGCSSNSSSEADPSTEGAPPHYKVATLLRADGDAGAASFVRKVAGISKMGQQRQQQQQQQQQRLDPPGKNPASSSSSSSASSSSSRTEKPEEEDGDIRGEERGGGTRAVATEVDDGALLLLRMLKTFHPTSSRNLGFANLEADSLEATPQQAQRLPSLFDLGAVSSPAYPPSIMGRQVLGCRPRRQSTPASRPRTQELAYAPPREEQALPSLSASVTLSNAVATRARHLHETPAWGSFVETPSTGVFDPYARDWVPPPLNLTFGKEAPTLGGRGTGGLVTGAGLEGRQDFQLRVRYRRGGAGGYPAAPGMASGDATSGMGTRFSKCSGPARYPNSNFRRYGANGDYYSG